MKNLKVSMKLIVSFLIVIALAILVGAVGIVGMGQISAADTDLYNLNLIAIKAMGNMNYITASMRMHYRNFVIYDATNPQFAASEQAIKECQADFEANMTAYQGTVTTEDDQAKLDKINQLYTEVLVGQAIPEIMELGRNNDTAGAMAAMEKYAGTIGELEDILVETAEFNTQLAEQAVEGNKTLSSTMTIAEIAVLAVAVAIAVFLALYISRLISKPLVLLTAFMKKAGATGDLTLSPEDVENISQLAMVKDEIGQCIGSTADFVSHLSVISSELQTVSDGDLTVDVKLLSDKDTMGISLKKVVDSLNSMFSEIHTASTQVSVGSKQIADGSQSLAQGSTEQASAIEQLSASISEIKDKTSQNADVAREAANLSDAIRGSAEKGSTQMDQMMQAVKEINDASGQISKVIKVIDDIAFQTNILALNAAVEAARAGQHGKGFAVVAEEVRNLAAKSAEAAKDTGGLIENSIEKANFGLSIAIETADSLKEIVEGIIRSAAIVSQIAQASDEQAVAIGQINTGIDQVAQVVQQNSATAEESAAASQEMSGQSNMLEELIAQFKLKEGSTGV